MQLLDLTLATIGENLAADEALLLQAEAGQSGEVLRFWESPTRAAILGSGGRVAEEVNLTACQSDGVAILRRSSGGGTVLLGPGCLLFTLILDMRNDSALETIRGSYLFILERIVHSLADLLPGIRCRGVSDLAAGDRKFSGNAQQRKRNYLLHHGTLLHAFDLPTIARYLRPPPRQPDYRRGRDHLDFVCNLPTKAQDLRGRLQQAWQANDLLPDLPRQRIQELMAEKYGREDWHHRR